MEAEVLGPDGGAPANLDSEECSLNYVARAGLLPELSRQTYDTLWKALREAVLNSMDAGARSVDINLSRASSGRTIEVVDDGSGMSLGEFREHFMSLGGSNKFGDTSRFGRIGIGSLALLQYGKSAIVETKRAGEATATRARIEHAWDLDRVGRSSHLADLSAGTASEFTYQGSPNDHFTRLTIVDVNDEVAKLGRDPNALYEVIERLRRTLPLTWTDGPMLEHLADTDLDLASAIRAEVEEWSACVTVNSAWESGMVIDHRAYGDDGAGSEQWTGPPWPILKRLRVNGPDRRREITIAGFLLNQRNPLPNWAGVTARVQNVAVEENTFFELTSDPGFRKYITGEIWVLGDLQADRLINIDRASFNRESLDYQVIQRFMQRAVTEFKTSRVQAPQRAKVPVRRALQEHLDVLSAVEAIVSHAHKMNDGKALPASGPNKNVRGTTLSLSQILTAAGARVIQQDDVSKKGYEIRTGQADSQIEVLLEPDLLNPEFTVDGKTYSIQIVRGTPASPPIVVKERRARVIINAGHPSFSSGITRSRVAGCAALEMAALLNTPSGSAESLYELTQVLLATY